MEEKLNKPEPKKIKMPPLVDRLCIEDTMVFTEPTWHGRKLLEVLKNNEDNSENNTQSLSELKIQNNH